LLENGFTISGFCEPTPAESLMDMHGMADELRRPMMLIISAIKNKKSMEKSRNIIKDIKTIILKWQQIPKERNGYEPK
jgi:hypothetical protein